MGLRKVWAPLIGVFLLLTGFFVFLSVAPARTLDQLQAEVVQPVRVSSLKPVRAKAPEKMQAIRGLPAPGVGRQPAIAGPARETVSWSVPQYLQTPVRPDRVQVQSAGIWAELSAVEMMKAAARETDGPEHSQLDAILAVLEGGAKTVAAEVTPVLLSEITPLPGHMAAEDSAVLNGAARFDVAAQMRIAAAPLRPAVPGAETVPDVGTWAPAVLKRPKMRSAGPEAQGYAHAVPARPLPEIARAPLDPKITRANFKTRPVSRPGKPQAFSDKRPKYSAQHFHKLRFHGRDEPSQIACVAELQLIADRAQIYFASASAAVNSAGLSAARLIAAKAQSCPEAAVEIIGFTDPGGSRELNLKLSWLRANAVYKTIEESGFSMRRIQVSSHMEDHPDECLHYEGVDRRVLFNVREKK